MANNIGTQLTAQLDDISATTAVLQSLAIMGTCLKDYDGFEALANALAYVEERHSRAVDDLDTLIRQRVLPIVAHINTGL